MLARVETINPAGAAVKKIVIAVCCLVVVAAAGYGWSAYHNKQRFEAVMADYAKEQPAHR